ncbi:MAG: accessory factor UbiK family protein [Pseudomonadota bacterium]|nr:accessory factor UbiK family protein [Pseudomonadota bacterium]
MQSKNPFINDIARLMTSALGVAQSAKSEMETAISSAMERWLAERNFVTREEFDAVRTMATQTAEKNLILEKKIRELETTLKKVKPRATKGVRKSAEKS